MNTENEAEVYRKRDRRTGRRVGRPTNDELAERLLLTHAQKEEVRRLRRLKWGGARAGAGRPKGKVLKERASVRVVNVSPELEAKLGLLPPGARDEYLAKALDLMFDISPPAQFTKSSDSVQPGPNKTADDSNGSIEG